MDAVEKEPKMLLFPIMKIAAYYGVAEIRYILSKENKLSHYANFLHSRCYLSFNMRLLLLY